MDSSLLVSLIKVSEKAANIARACRQDEHLFKLLVQEKSPDEKNPRFVQDFKTLADVLIQETIKHDIGKQFPCLKNYIFGEESNKFCNSLGDNIIVEVQEEENVTAGLLSKVLDSDEAAGNLLAKEVHRNVNIEDISLENYNIDNFSIPSEMLGIWIDPIDSTGEYISGLEGKTDIQELYSSGLHCVTVLIGVFNRLSGVPVVGVVNQPFFKESNSKWQGRCIWGYSFEASKSYCIPEILHSNPSEGKVIVLSASESPELKHCLQAAGYKIVYAAGAGYKLMCVALGLAQIYLLSHSTTFQWDTCAPHAVLSALGGGIVSYISAQQGSPVELTYTESLGSSQNAGGIIAYRSKESLSELLEALLK